jgi:hypothetical protein
MTQCTAKDLFFQDLGSREVVARFDGGQVTSDAGALLLREIEHKFHFIEQFARCFTDHRDPDLVEHTLPELLKQRIFGLCLGYEDVNDHDQLRHDPLLAVLADKKDPQGEERVRGRDRGKALAGKSTLNRLELTPVRANADSRYKKIVAHLDVMQTFFVNAFLQQYFVPPARIVLDVDATNNPLHTTEPRIVQAARALSPAGVFTTAIAARTNALVEFWISGFGLLGREVPYYTSEDVEASLHELGTAYQKHTVDYQLAFPWFTCVTGTRRPAAAR